MQSTFLPELILHCFCQMALYAKKKTNKNKDKKSHIITFFVFLHKISLVLITSNGVKNIF